MQGPSQACNQSLRLEGICDKAGKLLHENLTIFCMLCLVTGMIFENLDSSRVSHIWCYRIVYFSEQLYSHFRSTLMFGDLS